MAIHQGEKLYTTPEVAEILRMKKNTLEKWRCQKTSPLKYVSVMGRVLYRERDLREFIENSVIAPSNAYAVC